MDMWYFLSIERYLLIKNPLHEQAEFIAQSFPKTDHNRRCRPYGIL